MSYYLFHKREKRKEQEKKILGRKWNKNKRKVHMDKSKTLLKPKR